jgi:hypothetical protein
MTTIEEIKNVGKYRFKITDNTLFLRDEIYCRNMKIGGDNLDCVNVSISYNNNKPVSASIPYILFDPDCSIANTLDRGQGSIIMINTLLEYVHEKIPTIQEINFEDKSNIECANQIEIEKGSKNRKIGTLVLPIPLYYFSIAFNGETWYEKNFNAKLKDDNKHTLYRETLKKLLNSKEPFINFLKNAKPSEDIRIELEPLYEKSDNLGNFFQSISKEQRCRLVREWITTFMSYHLKDIFSNTDWIIELPIVKKGGGIKKNKKSRRKYYIPKSNVRLNQTYKDLGIRPEDI